MDSTTLTVEEHQSEELSQEQAHSLYEMCKQIGDKRAARGKQYDLAGLLLVLLLAKFAGMKSLSGASDWVRDQAGQLRKRRKLSWKQMPCANTYKYVFYQWNRLEEAHSLLSTIVQDATAWPHLNVLRMGYACLIQIELARGEWSLAALVLHELEQLVERERYWTYSDWLLTLRAQWWLAQGQLKEASDWVRGVFFPEGRWDRNLYDAFPIVIRVYFVQQGFREALNLLERWSGHLDRPANVRITITYLAQLLVALHQASQHAQVHVIAERLFALTEPEGYLRVFLDEGEPMKEALQALFTPHSQQHEWAVSSTASIAKVLAAFEQEQSDASRSEPALSSARPPAVVSSAPGISLTRREQEVLRLLATGASNQDIAQTLVVSVDTVKKHVSHLFGKLGASSRTQAVALTRAHLLL